MKGLVEKILEESYEKTTLIQNSNKENFDNIKFLSFSFNREQNLQFYKILPDLFEDLSEKLEKNYKINLRFSQTNLNNLGFNLTVENVNQIKPIYSLVLEKMMDYSTLLTQKKIQVKTNRSKFALDNQLNYSNIQIEKPNELMDHSRYIDLLTELDKLDFKKLEIIQHGKPDTCLIYGENLTNLSPEFYNCINQLHWINVNSK